MSNTTTRQVEATYEVRTGNGRTVTITGDADDLDKITHQMQMHADLVKFLRQIKGLLSGDGEYVITRQDKEKMWVGDQFQVGDVFELGDRLLKELGDERE